MPQCTWLMHWHGAAGPRGCLGTEGAVGLGMAHPCTAPGIGDSGTEPQHLMLMVRGTWQAAT